MAHFCCLLVTFSQIFVILVRKERDADFSILFYLLPDKKVEIHIKLFNITHEFWPQLNPNNINVDYKLAVHQNYLCNVSRSITFGITLSFKKIQYRCQLCIKFKINHVYYSCFPRRHYS